MGENMGVKYEFTIKKWNPSIDLKSVVDFYNGELKPEACDCLCGCHKIILIPYINGYEFEEKLKQFDGVEYQITSVLDVPIDENNMVIDSSHPNHRKEDWLSIE